MRRLCWLLAFVAPPSFAGPVGYAQATGYYKKDSRPTLYQPLNLLDGREATAWCTSSADPLNDELTFGFKGPAKIDEIRIYTGNGFDEKTFAEFARVKRLSIKGPSGAETISVADQRGLQAIPFNPPLVGEHFTMEVMDIYPGEDPDSPACITDVVFYQEGKPLNGSWLTQKLKYDKHQAPLLGTWFAGHEGAPDRFVSFFFDGTYRFLFHTYDPDVKDRSFGGTYDASGGRLSIEVPPKGRVSAKIHREGAGKGAHTLTLEGDLPEDLKQTYRDHL